MILALLKIIFYWARFTEHGEKNILWIAIKYCAIKCKPSKIWQFLVTSLKKFLRSHSLILWCPAQKLEFFPVFRWVSYFLIFSTTKRPSGLGDVSKDRGCVALQDALFCWFHMCLFICTIISTRRRTQHGHSDTHSIMRLSRSTKYLSQKSDYRFWKPIKRCIFSGKRENEKNSKGAFPRAQILLTD